MAIDISGWTLGRLTRPITWITASSAHAGFSGATCGSLKIIASSCVRSGLRTWCGCRGQAAIAQRTKPNAVVWPFPKWPEERSGWTAV